MGVIQISPGEMVLTGNILETKDDRQRRPDTKSKPWMTQSLK
jgi:hypothetical protein